MKWPHTCCCATGRNGHARAAVPRDSPLSKNQKLTSITGPSSTQRQCSAPLRAGPHPALDRLVPAVPTALPGACQPAPSRPRFTGCGSGAIGVGEGQVAALGICNLWDGWGFPVARVQELPGPLPIVPGLQGGAQKPALGTGVSVGQRWLSQDQGLYARKPRSPGRGSCRPHLLSINEGARPLRGSKPPPRQPGAEKPMLRAGLSPLCNPEPSSRTRERS